MSASQRRKGQAAERELCRLLSDELGVEIRRNVDQARCGGADCLELNGFAIEIKRHERLSRPSWWAQAVKQAERARAEPILFYRRSREPWRAMLHRHQADPVDVTLEAALCHIREKWSSWP
ncbi:hypothetical protein UFOVP73_37 [uncultured Caudovirales phage]|uniref:Uncharacterized protein n=1 Tax=uncultured Caudovirales phage TaxID=2100421 RepID=A0A6J5KXR8_9CAUD|nr:hypothetical protein UFOVP73_37 [uncultured Caudovirales phage]CAB5195178.1 hypothetical protein UFOVP170_59 [uncultured Caudovirales phage]